MSSDNYINNTEESINIKKQILKYFQYWNWFVISIIICIISALIYLNYTHNIYRTTAKIKILDKEQNELKLPTAQNIFKNNNINLENEIALLSSSPILRKTINDLQLTTSFYALGNIMKSRVISPPFSFNQLINPYEITEKLSFKIKFNKKGLEIHNEIKDTTYNFKTYSTFGIDHDLPFNLRWDTLEISKKYEIVFSPIKHEVNKLKKALKTSVFGEESDIILLQLDNANYNYSERILNTIINVFNQDGIEDRQMIHKRTIEFINERYLSLSNELDSIEIEKQLYKNQNNLTDIKFNTSLSLELSSKSSQKNLDLENQITLANLLNESFNDNKHELLPANIGIKNSEINFLIKDFNTLIINRNNLIVSAGLNNPSVKQLNRTINDSRLNISRSVNNYLNQLEETKKQLEIQNKKLSEDVSNLPKKEKILRSIERSQQIKESLYLFLLQKREESQVSFAVTEPSLKIVEYASSSDKPIFPKRVIFLFSSFLFSLFVPFTIIYLRFLFDTKIQTKNDVRTLSPQIPIIAEIPEINEKDKKTINSLNNRNAFSESFRVAASNINYLLNPEIKSNVILSTSTIKGEGKTVSAINISLTLSSFEKKVLLVGADLRNPQLHKHMNINKNEKGLVDFLKDSSFDWKSTIIKGFENYGQHHTLLAGTIPPNPTQLLSNGNFEKLINEAKKEFDFIVVDSAPTLLVTDTLIISKNVDATIYVCRSNYTEKELFGFIQELINEKKLKNLGVIINSISAQSKYGYNYGYGYGYSEDKDSS